MFPACIECSLSASVELRFLSGIGEAFPPSLESDKTRFVGLLGDVLIRAGCIGVVLRSDGRADRGCAACRLEGGAIGVSIRVLSEFDLLDGERGDGEKGMLPLLVDRNALKD